MQTPETQQQQQQFRLNQRVHRNNNTHRIGTIKYIGELEVIYYTDHCGTWIGVEWGYPGGGKNDGSVNGVRYFQAEYPDSASFARPQSLSPGVSFLEALDVRYRTSSTKEEEDEMYVRSVSYKRVNVELVGKSKIEDILGKFEELPGASLSYLGVSSPGDPVQISKTLPNLKELDLTGNLLSEWQDVDAICSGLPALTALNLANNLMSNDVVAMSHLKNLRLLVINSAAIKWSQVEALKNSLQAIEELHLMGNKMMEITPTSSKTVQGFDTLRLLNLEDNYISDWSEILKLSQLKSLEQLHLNKNNIERIWYPAADELSYSSESPDKSYKPFQNLRCLLIGSNKIEDVASIDALNSYPALVDVRCSDNPATDPKRGGIARFALVARLAKVKTLNGSEITPRERKESEIRYVRLVMSKPHQNLEEIKRLHPRFTDLKSFHGIEDARPSNGPSGKTSTAAADTGNTSGTPSSAADKGKGIAVDDTGNTSGTPSSAADKGKGIAVDDTGNTSSAADKGKGIAVDDGLGPSGPQKMASGLIAVTLKCVGPSIGEKPPLTKKLPATTTVGKLKTLCESFFKLKSIKPILYLQEEGSPLPTLLDDDMSSLNDAGVCNLSTILIDEEN